MNPGVRKRVFHLLSMVGGLELTGASRSGGRGGEGGRVRSEAI